MLIGSGLTVFAITTIYDDFYKQPMIQVNFDPPQLSSNSSSLYVRLYVTNYGPIPANNVTIIMNSGTNITYDPLSLLYTENTKDVRIDNDGPSKLIISTPRLVGTSGLVSLTEALTPPPTLGLGPKGNFEVRVAYETGSMVNNYNIDKSGIKQTSQTTESQIQDFLIYAGLLSAVFFFFIPQIYRLIKNIVSKSYRAGIYFQILNEVIGVLEMFKKDVNSTRILPPDMIDYREINPSTKSFFHNYEDFKLISEFYSKLRRRDIDLSSGSSYLTPEIHNTECYNQGLKVLKNIKWRNYGILIQITKKRNIISTLLAVFPGAGHIALLRIRRGLIILLSFVVTFVGFAAIALYYLSWITYPIVPNQESVYTVVYNAVVGVIIVWLLLYAWQIIDLRKQVGFIRKVQSYLRVVDKSAIQ
jgi:hypothetical protein